MQILIAILAFCALIIIHELGHFTAAKLCGIQVNEFALGMGPVIFRWQGKETAYVIRLFPLGGAVSMEGENGGYDEQGENPPAPNMRAFNRKPVWQRMIVILAGPLMNLILGYFTVMISLCTSPVIASTTISEFREQSVSCSSLMIDDKILAIEGMSVFSASDITYKLQSSDRRNDAGNLVFDIKVKRGGETITLNDVVFMTMEREDGSTGIYFDFYVYRLEKNFGNIVVQSFMESCSTGRLIYMTLFDMLSGKYGLNDLSGPVGVVQAVSQSVTYGLETFLYYLSIISINVGIMNLLPIPALDGCRFIFLIVEAIRRKPIKPEIEGMIHFVGFALLMILMLVVTINDISRLITGG